jgi:2-haloalkanoic acid dehalogenase type II
VGFFNSIVNDANILPTGNTNYASLNDPTVNKILADAPKGGVTDAQWAQLNQSVLASGTYLPVYYTKTLYYRNPRMTNVTCDTALAFGVYDFVNIGVSAERGLALDRDSPARFLLRRAGLSTFCCTCPAPEHVFVHLIQGAGTVNLGDFEALSLDCYGTLIDWETGIAAVLRPWADAHRLDLTDEDLLTAYSTQEAEAEETHPAELYPQILARSMRALGETLGAPVSEDEAQSLAVSVPEWPAFPDSARALERLGRRYKLIILSNVDRQSFAGSNDKLGATFTSILTAQDIGSYKPSPRNFEALEREMDRLGVARGKLLHVAQSLFHDHVPAKAAGLPTVWINRRHATPGWGATPEPPAGVTPDWTFKSMAEFADAVDAEAR